MQISQIFLIFLSINSIISFPKSDLVESLPDYPYPGPFYAGYLHLNGTDKHFHYVFFPSQSDPDKDPLVSWMQGGPGCSALGGGFIQENGPALMIPGNVTFTLNPYAWNKKANLLYIDSPSGTGFSYSSNTDAPVSDDISSGRDNLLALLAFYEKFPSLKQRKFFITGESYGGIYIPYLASNILFYNELAAEKDKINLQGVLIGNGATLVSEINLNESVEMANKRNLLSEQNFNVYRQQCPNSLFDLTNSWDCSKAIGDITYVFQNVNLYHFYKLCGTFPSTMKSKSKKDIKKKKSSSDKNLLYTMDNIPAVYSYNCEIDGIPQQDYFNRIDVKKAMNAKTDIFWTYCSGTTVYENTLVGSFYLYPNLIRSGLRIQLYNGDADGRVPYFGTLKWIQQLGLNVKKNWRPWRVNKNRNAGFVIDYEGLTFVTIQGAGHEVPEWKPKEAYYMLEAFLEGKDISTIKP